MALETGAFMQASSYSAEIVRRAMFAQYARTSANNPGIISGGLIGATDFQISQVSSPNMTVNVSTGEAIVPGNEGGAQGGYYVRGTSTTNLAIATANPSNPRIDTVCLTCGDAQYTLPSGGTSGSLTLQVVTGTPTAGATLSNLSGAAALSGSSLLLGYVWVPAGASSIVTADIANKATVVTFQPITAGQFLATMTYNPAAGGSQNTSSPTLTGINSNLFLSAIAPPSGNMLVRWSGWASLSGSNNASWIGLVTTNGGTTQLGPAREAMISNGSATTIVYEGLVTGLTPGTAYTPYAAFSSNAGTTFTIGWGGSVASASGGCFTMTAQAA